MDNAQKVLYYLRIMRFKDGPLAQAGPDAALYVERSFEHELLEMTLNGANILVNGSRGSGKTTSLRKLAADLRENGRHVAIVNAAPARGVSQLVELITDALELPMLPPDERLVSPVVELVRAVRHLELAPTSTIIVLDADDIDALFELFGRLREEVWALDHQWVIEADSVQSNTLNQPPASGFFRSVFTVGELNEEEISQLLHQGLDGNELTTVLDDAVLPIREFPREVIQFARGTIDGTLERDEEATLRRHAIASSAGRSRYMALVEVEARDAPIAADDPVLLRRLGWTRAHAARTLASMADLGLLRSFSARNPKGGRPRRMYLPNQDPPAP